MVQIQLGAQRAWGYNAKGEIFGPTLEFFYKPDRQCLFI